MNRRKNLLIAQKGVDLLSGEPTGVDCRPIHEPSDDLVVLELVRGRRLLVNLTGEDFGFDLAKWLEFIGSNPQFNENGQFTDPEVWKLFLLPKLERHQDRSFGRYLALADESWRSGAEADVTYDSLRDEVLAARAKVVSRFDSMTHS